MPLYLPKLHLRILYIMSVLPLRRNFILATRFYIKNWYLQQSNRKQYQHPRNGNAIYIHHLLWFHEKRIHLLFFVLLSDMWSVIFCGSQLESSTQLYICCFYLSYACSDHFITYTTLEINYLVLL